MTIVVDAMARARGASGRAARSLDSGLVACSVGFREKEFDELDRARATATMTGSEAARSRRRADACAEAGLLGCLRVPENGGLRGVCTLACAVDEDCPAALEGEASGRCAAVGERRVCVLSCMDGETCPEGHVCLEVAGVDAGAARLCFPEARP